MGVVDERGNQVTKLAAAQTVCICYNPTCNPARFKAGRPVLKRVVPIRNPARFIAGWPEAVAGLI